MNTTPGSDQHLVATFAQQGSESAFQAIVSRHVDLVYATALRQLGDAGLAEEVTQNVFIVLSRKAPRLAALETLAGWLHRTALLESKARIRSELRRREREHKAGELAALQAAGASPMAPLIPLVDEALLHLRETDRLALVLRYLEEQPLGEVGAALGLNEDAARKRVARALERLAAFFRAKGFAVPAGSAAAAVLAHSTAAAPAALAAAVTQTAVAGATAAAGFNWLVLHLMTLSKAQIVVIGLAIATVPVAWQRHTHAELRSSVAALDAQAAFAASRSQALESELLQVRDSTRRALANTLNAENRLAHLKSLRDGQAPPPVYRWEDRNWLVRIPKNLLEQLPVSATTDKRGQLSEQIKEMLQLSDSESESTQAAIDKFLAGFHTAQAGQMRAVPPAPNELNGAASDEVRAFEFHAVSDQLKSLRATLFSEVETALGTDRAALFRKGLEDWMPLDERGSGLNSGAAVFDFDHREHFVRPQPGDAYLAWGVTKPNGELFRATMSIEEIPDFLRPALTDWIALAQSKPSQP